MASAASKLHLYNMDVCPFAQRTKMSLLEKGVAFDETVIDPRDKPAWFLEMNPKGKLPVVVHDGKLVRESAVVLEYLEEALPGPALMPDDPYERSRLRLFLSFFNTEYLPAFYKCILSPQATDRETLAGAMRARLEDLNDGLLDLRGPGPYFGGARYSLLDISVAPFIERHAAVVHFVGVDIPQTTSWSAFHDWWAAVEERPSFKQLRKDDAHWVKVYVDYAEGRWGRTYFDANPPSD